MLLKKTSVALSIATAFTLSLSIPALAGNGNNETQGDNNGKPFQELRQIIDENHALIDANQGDISELKASVAQLNATVDNIDGRMTSLNDQVAQNAQTIETALAKIDQNAGDIVALRTELLTVHQQLSGAITTLRSEVLAMESEVKGSIAQLQTASEALKLKMTELEQTIAQNAVATDGLQIQVVTLVSQVSNLNAQATTLNWSYQGLQTRVGQLETGAVEIEQQILQLTTDIAALAEGQGSDDGLPKVNACFTLNNTGAVNLGNSSWFDRCVDAEGSKVMVVLRDPSGNVVYKAEGDKVGDWSYNYVTASRYYHQESVYNHDKKITLDNGDKLVITGRGATGYACSTETGNGYFIRVVNANSQTKMAVTSYRRLGSGWGGTRYFYDWTPNHEISYDNGNTMYGCSNDASKNFEAFHGTFDFYVLP